MMASTVTVALNARKYYDDVILIGLDKSSILSFTRPFPSKFLLIKKKKEGKGRVVSARLTRKMVENSNLNPN